MKSKIHKIDFACFEYPFRRHRFSEDAIGHMRSFTGAFIDQHSLFEDAKYYVEVSCEFLAACACPKLKDRELEIMCLFLLTFLILNDFRNHHKKRLADLGSEFLRILSNRSYSPAIFRNYCACLQELLRRIQLQSEQNGIAAITFYGRLANTIDAFSWEDDAIQNNLEVTEEEYLKNRPHLVGNRPFLEVNRLCAGLDHRRFCVGTRSKLADLENLSTKLVYLSNDIFSFYRELDEGKKTNLVSVVAAERSWPISDSVTYVQSLHDDAVARFIELKNEFSYEEEELDSCVELIEVDSTGNVEGMNRLKARY